MGSITVAKSGASVDVDVADSHTGETTRSPAVTVDWDSVSRFKQPEDSLGYLLWQTAHGWMRQLNGELLEMGLTHLQMIALGSTLWLTRIGGAPSQARLAKFCAEMDPMLISKVVRMPRAEVRGTVRPRSARQFAAMLLSVTV